MLASRHDPDAVRVVTASGGRARLLTAEDLTREGWRWRLGDGAGTAVVAGEVVEAAEIDAVLVRRPTVAAAELSWIVPADRAYVAAELHAFLVAWLVSLAALGCRVVNRPTAGCLSGPGWRPERWTALATRIGLPAAPARRSVHPAAVGSDNPQPPGRHGPTQVTVVGDTWYGAVAADTGAGLVRLARAAGVDLLAARVDRHDGRLLTADAHPVLDEPQVIDAVLAHLQRPRGGER
ncbi:hypothetical protein [Kitasatospora cinereorecta]|uniref:Uncharacterized protein n=1 Tax=Kitasatospora cinereorecta TaxID=285560 RepID=A0ABW0VT93_9ACTN